MTRRKSRTSMGARAKTPGKARRDDVPVPSRGLRAFADARTRRLVIGTLPGQASLFARQYYAQPHNAFWRIIEDVYGVGRALPYEQRIEALLSNGLGLWDVCASAHRPGSLDASIARETIVPNDFARLYRRCPGIELICFNGATAAALYRRLVLPKLPAGAAAIRAVQMPSSSPAHASMRYADKLERWRQLLL